MNGNRFFRGGEGWGNDVAYIKLNFFFFFFFYILFHVTLNKIFKKFPSPKIVVMYIQLS